MTDSTKYKVPSNLRPLLESFTRETLRNQPGDLVQFGRLFFDTLADIQKEHKSDVITDEKAYYAFRSALQNNIKNPLKTKAFSQPDSNSDSKQGSIPSTQRAPHPTVMQIQQPSAPGSSNNSRPSTPAELAAATKIQAAYRGHFVRNHPEKFGIDTMDYTRRSSTDRLHSADNKKDLKRHSVGGYTLEGLTNSPDDRAATRIQAEIRGYLARRHVEAMKQKNLEAATKIQAHVRGYLTRKKLHDGDDSPARRQSVNSNA